MEGGQAFQVSGLAGCNTTFEQFKAAITSTVTSTGHPKVGEPRLELIYRVYKDLCSKASWKHVNVWRRCWELDGTQDGDFFVDGLFAPVEDPERKKRPRTLSARPASTTSAAAAGVVTNDSPSSPAKKARTADSSVPGSVAVGSDEPALLHGQQPTASVTTASATEAVAFSSAGEGLEKIGALSGDGCPPTEQGGESSASRAITPAMQWLPTPFAVFPLSFDESIQVGRLLQIATHVYTTPVQDSSHQSLMVALCNEIDIVYQEVYCGIAEPSPEKLAILMKMK